MIHSNRTSTYGFAVLMLLSGFAGISYEILYGRMLGNLIGDQFAVSAAILMTFLFGIGVGASYAHRLWRYLWLIEAGIGLYGLLFVLGTEVLDRLLYAVPGGLSGTIGLCAVLLIIPAFLIGCSIPLFAGYLSHLTLGAVFSRVYAIYHFGAAVTALAIEFYLIRTLGIQGAVLSFVAINALVAVLLRLGFQQLQNIDQRTSKPTHRLKFSDGAALVLVSIGSAIFQIFMLKFAELTLGPFRESFALVLSLVLLGLALGSALMHRWRIHFFTILVLTLIGLLWMVVGADVMIQQYAAWYPAASASYFNTILLKWLFLAALMGLPAICFGAAIPALLRSEGNISRESGRLLFISAMANVLGFVLMVFVLHQWLDYGVQLLAPALLTALAIVVLRRFALKPALLAGGLLAVIVLAQTTYWDEDLLYLSYTKFHASKTLDKARGDFEYADKFKGHQDVFSINWKHGKPYFFINGYTSFPLDHPSEKIVGALSALFSPRADQALVLGLGSGATAATVGELFEHTDVIEINPVVRDNLFRMKRWNYDIEQNPNVTIVVDDAIHYTKLSQKQYSLILNTVTTPLYFSSSKLYTTEFLNTIHQRLTPDGVYATWVDSRIGDRGVDITLKTLAQTFAHCAVFYIRSGYFLLLCSDQPIQSKTPNMVTDNPRLHTDLLLSHGILSQWLPYHLLSTDALALIGQTDAEINRVDFPALAFEIARLRHKGLRRFKKRLIQQMNLADLRQAIVAIDDNEAFPADLIRYSQKRLGRSSKVTRKWKRLARKEPNYPEKRALAKLHYRQAQAQILDTAKAHHKHGYRLMKLKRYDAAIAAFKRALAKNSRNNDTLFNIAFCHEHQGQFEQALRYYARELAVDHNDTDAHYRMGKINLQRKQYALALRQLTQAVARSDASNRAKRRYYLGLTLAGLGRKDDAVEAFRQAMGVGPAQTAVWQALLRVLQAE